jgi:hypothetical protein
MCCIKIFTVSLESRFFYFLEELELWMRVKKAERTSRWEEGTERPQFLGEKQPSFISTKDL